MIISRLASLHAVTATATATITITITIIAAVAVAVAAIAIAATATAIATATAAATLVYATMPPPEPPALFSAAYATTSPSDRQELREGESRCIAAAAAAVIVCTLRQPRPQTPRQALRVSARTTPPWCAGSRRRT